MHKLYVLKLIADFSIERNYIYWRNLCIYFNT